MKKEHNPTWRDRMETLSRVSDVVDFTAVVFGIAWGYAGLLGGVLFRRWLHEGEDDNRVKV